MSIDFTPHAVHDIDTAAEYLEVEKAGGGARFRDDLAHLLARLERLPESTPLYEPPRQRLPGLRVAQLSRFKSYAVFYQPTDAGIRVVRMLHTARNIALIFGPDPDPPPTNS